MNIYEEIKKFLNAGLCAIPASSSKKFTVLGSWKEYQTRKPTIEEVDAWAKKYPNADAIAIITGAISGGLETLDFDFEGVSFNLFEQKAREVLKDGAGCLDLITIESTQSGGKHVFYRVKGGRVDKNEKLANVTREELLKHNFKNDKTREKAAAAAVSCTIETRGEGGLVIVSPSKGYSILNGSFNLILEFSPEKVEELKNAARACGNVAPRTIPQKEQANKTQPAPAPAFSSADWLRDNPGYIESELLKNGWQIFCKKAEETELTRPGKNSGVSAVLHKDGHLHVFTTSTNFENKTYSPLEVVAMLNYNGDTKAASKDIFKENAPKITPIVNDETAGVIFEEQEQKKESAPEFPFDIEKDFEKDSFISQYIKTCLDASKSDAVELAFVGAFGALAHIISNKVKVNGSFPNIYICAQAPTGTGKNLPITHNTNIFNYYSQNSYTGKVESAQALQDLLVDNSQICINQDEFGSYLKNAKRGGGAFVSKILEFTTDIWNKSGEEVKQSASLSNKKRNGQAAAMYKPYLSIIAFSQPSQMTEIFKQENALSGMTARFFFPIITRRVHKTWGGKFDLSATSEEKAIIDNWKEFLKLPPKEPAKTCRFTAAAGDFASYEDENAPDIEGVFNIPIRYDVRDRWTIDADKREEERNAAQDMRESEHLISFLSRTEEYLQKLAAIFAANKYGANRATLCVDSDVYEKSVKLLNYFKDCLIYSLEESNATALDQSEEEGSARADISRFYKKCFLPTNKRNLTGEKLVSSTLVCKMFKNRLRRENLLTTLKEAEVFTGEFKGEENTGGRKAKYYIIDVEKMKELKE